MDNKYLTIFQIIERECGFPPPEVEQVDLTKLIPKMDYVDSNFVDTVRRLGILIPVILADVGEKLVIISGKRRVRAAHAAGHSRIPAHVYRATAFYQGAVATMTENAHRSYNPVVEMEVICLLEKEGYTESEIANLMGIPIRLVRKRRVLAYLPATELESIRNGVLTVTMGEHLAFAQKKIQLKAEKKFREENRLSLIDIDRLQETQRKLAVQDLPEFLQDVENVENDVLGAFLRSLTTASLLDALGDCKDAGCPDFVLDQIEAHLPENECSCTPDSEPCIACVALERRTHGNLIYF